jgi:hypothetical protein
MSLDAAATNARPVVRAVDPATLPTLAAQRAALRLDYFLPNSRSGGY